MSSLAITAPHGWEAGTVVEAIAGESSVGSRGQLARHPSVCLRAEFGPDWRVTALDGDLPGRVAGRLARLSVARGFRKELAAMTAEGLAPGSLAASLLDDLPAVRLIAGYARLSESERALAARGPRSAPQLSVCRGWAPGGRAHRLILSGQRPLTSTPEAPGFTELLAEPSDFLVEPAAQPNSMRRRRILEVTSAGPYVEAYEYFRDSHFDGRSREGSLHEYVVTAVLDTADLTVRDISVEPRALPFPECPHASGNAQSLVGASLSDLENSVRTGLSGTLGCTHLNDVLGFLRFVEPLVTAPANQSEV